ncbi:ABC transporter permease [Shewanella marina]|uniref:ABC transporter permease n=1 Tax=Shewanella marina TaxID=487319 RepID=UPI000470AD36|nr:ABC transporter permease [Shewanella marina]
MGIFLIRRLNLFIATSIALIGVLFLATSLFPVSKTVALAGITSPSLAQAQQITDDYQLNSSELGQFIAYLKQRLSGNLGISTSSQHPVIDELAVQLPATIELITVASILALLLGVPLGVLSALSHNKLTQNSIMVITLTGYSIPVFWLGLTLILWFGIKLGWLPVSGQLNLLYQIKPVTGFMLIDTLISNSPYHISAFLDALKHIVMPAVTLAILPFTVVVRITRSAMTQVLSQSYIRAAEARGLPTRRIIMRHALPNALLPVLKQLGLMLGPFMSYAIIVEVIFAWPGVGSWLVSGIYQRDYTVIQGGILAVSLLIIFASILIEVIYTAVNPLSRKELYASH